MKEVQEGIYAQRVTRRDEKRMKSFLEVTNNSDEQGERQDLEF